MSTVHRWDIFPLTLPHRLKDTSGFRFALANVAALTFVGIGIYIALPWIADLAGLITLPGAIVVIMFIAFIPGYLNAFLLASLLLFRQPKLDLNQTLPPISVLIAVYNEADNITETFRGLASQNYPNKIEVIFVNDGSTDSTLPIPSSIRTLSGVLLHGCSKRRTVPPSRAGSWPRTRAKPV